MTLCDILFVDTFIIAAPFGHNVFSVFSKFLHDDFMIFMLFFCSLFEFVLDFLAKFVDSFTHVFLCFPELFL